MKCDDFFRGHARLAPPPPPDPGRHPRRSTPESAAPYRRKPSATVADTIHSRTSAPSSPRNAPPPSRTTAPHPALRRAVFSRPPPAPSPAPAPPRRSGKLHQPCGIAERLECHARSLTRSGGLPIRRQDGRTSVHMKSVRRHLPALSWHRSRPARRRKPAPAMVKKTPLPGKEPRRRAAANVRPALERDLSAAGLNFGDPVFIRAFKRGAAIGVLRPQPRDREIRLVPDLSDRRGFGKSRAETGGGRHARCPKDSTSSRPPR